MFVINSDSSNHQIAQGMPDWCTHPRAKWSAVVPCPDFANSTVIVWLFNSKNRLLSPSSTHPIRKTKNHAPCCPTWYTELRGASAYCFPLFGRDRMWHLIPGCYFHAIYFESLLKIHVGYIIFHELITNNQDMTSDAEWSIVLVSYWLSVQLYQCMRSGTCAGTGTMGIHPLYPWFLGVDTGTPLGKRVGDRRCTSDGGRVRVRARARVRTRVAISRREQSDYRATGAKLKEDVHRRHLSWPCSPY